MHDPYNLTTATREDPTMPHTPAQATLIPRALRWATDSGHEWLKVPLAEYPDALDYGTGFGYLDARHGLAYLEGDLEASAFLDAHPAVTIGGEDYHDGSHPCRRLPALPDVLDVEAYYATCRARTS
jgi:hypothetical protein